MIKIYEYGMEKERIFARANPTENVSGTVAEIIAAVARDGDEALLRYAEKFDKVCLTSLEVTKEELDEAYENADKEFLAVLAEASKNICAFHFRQRREGFGFEREQGVIVGQKITPMEKVGLYVPGGTAAYPSTVLMNAIPAKIAGCKEIIMVTPPSKDGKVNPDVLAAARVAGVTRIFKTGGAQAIAALAYGTESIPVVDKIVGPGNAFVAEAKRQVFGRVAIDMIAGPSEILIVADKGSNPRHLAADLLSQAEHDKMASAVLVTEDKGLAEEVAKEIEVQLSALPREEIARASIESNGKIILVKDIEEGIAVANALAPEHLELCVEDPLSCLEQVKNAGSVFLGRYCPEAVGDYFAGPNHTLPTSGTARFSSPLSVDDFVKKTQFCYYTKEAMVAAADKIALFAEKEGLQAHANSARIRKEDE